MTGGPALMSAVALVALSGASFDQSTRRPDLVVAAVLDPPSSLPRRVLLRAGDTVRNLGGGRARRSVTRFYVSRDRVRSPRDVRLAGERRIRALSRNRVSRGAALVRVPAKAPRGAYFLLACADDRDGVREQNERNNCRASRRKTVVTTARPGSTGSARSARLYAATSPFNTPISAGARVDPDSAQYVAALKEVLDRRRFTISLRSWTVPVYETAPATPRADVRLTASWRGADWLRRVPIPAGAAPDPEDDAHMTVLDRERGCEFDFYRARNVDGRWYADWANTLRTTGNGVYPYAYSTRGSGFSNLAGLIWPDELRAGEIRHALMFSYPHTSARGAVAPATETDGQSTRPDALPEGARLQLDPALDLGTLPLRPYERTIARALQRYGMYLGDTGGGVNVYAIHPQSYPSDRYAGVLPPVAYPDLENIPIDRLRVLELGRVTPTATLRSRARLVPTGCATMR
jgi:CARDB